MLNRTVLITGGANGIGNSIAKMFIQQGCFVVICDIDEQKGNDFANDNPNAHFIQTDMSQSADVLNVFRYFVDNKKTIDILVNNVGVSVFKPLLELSIDEWDYILNTNLRAAFICSREFAKQHQTNTYGRIINIASTRHLMSEPNTEAYSASKGGLVSLTHALSMSLQSKNMTVNCISPGWIYNGDSNELTERDHLQHPSKRAGKPEDIANLCLFLCQPENDFITGQNYYVDGGMTKKMIYDE